MAVVAPLLINLQFVGVPLFAATESGRPNMVFILADDLGYGDIESFGADRCNIDTPHFDRLAAEGVRFTDAHSIASVCVPSRMSIMTGRYAFRFGKSKYRSGPWGFISPRLKSDQFTLGTMLKASGYRTGYVGKWHLGTLMKTKDGNTQGPTNVDYSQPLEIGPLQYGFDYSFILPGSLDMYPYVFVQNNQWVGQVTAQKGWSAFNRVGPAAEDFEDTKVLDTFCREAERFISENGDRPFFLYLALTAPHTPLSPTTRFQGKSRIGVYGDFVMETDDCVGRVLTALEAAGIDDNTIVIATSDHGPALYAGRRRKATFDQLRALEKEGHYSSGIYRGYKFSVYEGAFRVPYVVRWPGVAPAGKTCDRLVGLNDLMATLAEVVGYDLGDDRTPDSISFLSLLKDPESEPVRSSLIMQATQAMAIRSGPWKLAFCPGSGCKGTWGNVPKRDEAWRLAVEAFGRNPKNHEELVQPTFVQLFNLDDDPGETTNLAAKHPEKLRELYDLFQERVKRGRCTPGPSQKNDRANIQAFSAVPPRVWKP